MKKILVFGIMLLFVAALAACGNSNITDSPPSKTDGAPTVGIFDDEMPDDFGFKIDFGTYGKNNIDTFSHTFTKDLIIAGTETVDFVIPAAKMQEIYAAFKEHNIFELPNDINAEVEYDSEKTYTMHTPSNRYAVTYTCNNETRTIVCEDGGPWYADEGPPDSRNSLVALVDLIAEYIYSTEEYQKMPPAEGGYD